MAYGEDVKEALAEGIPSVRPFGDKDHPNAIRLKQAHEAFQKGDLDTVFSIFDPEIRWEVPGNNLMSGVFYGRDEVIKSFERLFALTDAYWAFPLDYFGSPNHAALVAHVRARRGNRELDCQEILLFKVNEAGRFSHLWHLALDEKAWHDFFSD